MSKELKQIKMHLNNLIKKYPDNKITYEEASNYLNIKVDNIDFELEYNQLNEICENHGTKAINSIIDIVEHSIIDIVEQGTLQPSASENITENV